MFKTQLFRVLLVMLAVGTLVTSCKKDDDDDDDKTVTPNVVLSGTLSGTTNLSADTIYELAGFVVVDSGSVINIAPGTIIKARQGAGSSASALIIARHGSINAVGDANNPIIFTSVLDNIVVGQKFGTNLTEENAGLWGGLIVLGDAPISDGDGDTEGQIEGIPADYSFGRYGGANDNDNSGTLAYISIRHNGTELKPNEELQGLTLGGVGKGTSISFIEVVASSDDGIEIFGGNVDLNNVLICYHQDDGLDLDQNYAGTIDNFFIVHEGSGAANAGFEFDGPEGSTYTTGKFTVKNGTVKAANGAAGRAITLKSSAQGTIQDCAFTGYTNWVSVEGGSATGNYASGDLTITGCEFVSSNPIASLVAADGASASDSTDIVTDFSAANTAVTTATKGANTSVFTGWTWTSENGLLD